MRHICVDDFNEMLEEYLINSIASMDIGEVTNCAGLFDPKLWDNLTRLERRYLFGCTLDNFVITGEVNLEFAECDHEGEILYRRT